MTKRAILITGGDQNFFPFILQALDSLKRIGCTDHVDVGIIDQGLDADQRARLSSLGVSLRRPEWTIDVPAHLRNDRDLGLIARTALRDYFPGYGLYMWFDADAWAQTPEFLDRFLEGARRHGIAVTPENGSGYRRNFRDAKWWYANFIAGYGAWDGARLCRAGGLNIGLMALSDVAPHWRAWVDHYTRLIRKTGKVNMDQHALAGALHLEGLPAAYLEARCNWICTMSTPDWDPDQRVLCEPGGGRRPISVLHLAGPDKARPYELRDGKGGVLHTPLTYEAVTALG